jgi:hypothetical protein
MNLPLQNFQTLVRNSAAALQGACAQLLDLSVGSVLRALLEANASIALWLQWVIFLVLGTTRAATSTGSDLDTWMADYGLVRLPAVAATGIVTCGRFTPAASALLPVGAQLRTTDGSQVFAVAADATNPAWSLTQTGYILAAGVASVNVPVAAVVPGSAGNAQAGTITLLGTAIPGVDTVSNAAAMSGGLDAESDAAFRARFANYIATLAEATTRAVEYAVMAVQQGIAVTVSENAGPQGNYRPGNFVVTIDDGSGSPPASLLATCSAAINAVRPIGSTYSVQPPSVLVANVSLSITVGANSTSAQIQPIVVASLIEYINALPIGATMPYTRLAQVAYDASPQVINVSSLVVNGGTADLSPGASGVVMAGTVTVD